MHPRYNQQAGFTLIELMVASAIFIVVTVTGVTVLITATNNFRTTSEIRQSMDTLSFVMEDMTRTIRLGTVFHCGNWASVELFDSCEVDTSANVGQLGGLFLALEGYNGIPNNPDDQVMYWISGGVQGNVTKGTLYKKTQSNLVSPSQITSFYPDQMPNIFSPITPSTIYLDMNQSGFSVSEPGSATTTPAITIRLSGVVSYKNTSVPFSIQSTVAPRNIPNALPQ